MSFRETGSVSTLVQLPVNNFAIGVFEAFTEIHNTIYSAQDISWHCGVDLRYDPLPLACNPPVPLRYVTIR